MAPLFTIVAKIKAHSYHYLGSSYLIKPVISKFEALAISKLVKNYRNRAAIPESLGVTNCNTKTPINDFFARQDGGRRWPLRQSGHEGPRPSWPDRAGGRGLEADAVAVLVAHSANFVQVGIISKGYHVNSSTVNLSTVNLSTVNWSTAHSMVKSSTDLSCLQL